MKAPYKLVEKNKTIIESARIRDFIYEINKYFNIDDRITRDDLVRLMYTHDIYVFGERHPAVLKYLEILNQNNWIYEEDGVLYIRRFI